MLLSSCCWWESGGKRDWGTHPNRVRNPEMERNLFSQAHSSCQDIRLWPHIICATGHFYCNTTSNSGSRHSTCVSTGSSGMRLRALDRGVGYAKYPTHTCLRWRFAASQSSLPHNLGPISHNLHVHHAAPSNVGSEVQLGEFCLKEKAKQRRI